MTTFDHKHYVPILKTKAGELWALANLERQHRTRLTPLLELHRPKKEKDKPPVPLRKHVNNVCDDIAKSWGRMLPFFLDTEWIKQKNHAAALTAVLGACRAKMLSVIPVVRLGYDTAALDVIKSVIEGSEAGYMLRIDFEDASAHPAIGGVVNHLGLPKGRVHLMLDYREKPMNLGEDVQRLPSILEWKTFSAASAAFPRTIFDLPVKLWNELPRSDWKAWEAAVASGALPRKPTFSDHATRCSGPPPGGGDPKVHLRYTKDSHWFVYSDGRVRDGQSPRMRSICRNLIAKPELFSGREFSQGDREIYRIARTSKEKKKNGGTQGWVQWGVNHHLAFAVTQIQSHSGI